MEKHLAAALLLALSALGAVPLLAETSITPPSVDAAPAAEVGTTPPLPIRPSFEFRQWAGATAVRNPVALWVSDKGEVYTAESERTGKQGVLDTRYTGHVPDNILADIGLLSVDDRIAQEKECCFTAAMWSAVGNTSSTPPAAKAVRSATTSVMHRIGKVSMLPASRMARAWASQIWVTSAINMPKIRCIWRVPSSPLMQRLHPASPSLPSCLLAMAMISNQQKPGTCWPFYNLVKEASACPSNDIRVRQG